MNKKLSAHKYVRDKVSKNMDGRILDIGCGCGLSGMELKSDFKVGADINLDYLREASRFYDVVVCCDATNLPFKDNSFIYSTCVGLLHHIINKIDICANELRRVSSKAICAEPNLLYPNGLFMFILNKLFPGTMNWNKDEFPLLPTRFNDPIAITFINPRLPIILQRWIIKIENKVGLCEKLRYFGWWTMWVIKK